MATPGTTVKVHDEANDLLEFYLGYLRMSGQRVNKEETASDLISTGIKLALPQNVLALFGKDKKGLREARKQTSKTNQPRQAA